MILSTIWIFFLPLFLIRPFHFSETAAEMIYYPHGVGALSISLTGTVSVNETVHAKRTRLYLAHLAALLSLPRP